MTNTSHGDDVAFIRALAELLRENDLTELEVKREYAEDNALNVRVMRAPPAVMQPAPAPMIAAPSPGPGPAPVDSAGAAPQPSDDPATHPGAVPSPMVGTVYLQAEPGTEPFIRVGSSVSAGQTILIIEAMKTMNQIAAPHGGTVTRILVDDGSPVEYGAPLVIIE